MYRLFKRPFGTKIIIECKRHIDVEKQSNIIIGEIKYDNIYNVKKTICDVEIPKYFELNLSNVKENLLNTIKKDESIDTTKNDNMFNNINKNNKDLKFWIILLNDEDFINKTIKDEYSIKWSTILGLGLMIFTLL
jgi:hypothetical protein